MYVNTVVSVHVSMCVCVLSVCVHVCASTHVSECCLSKHACAHNLCFYLDVHVRAYDKGKKQRNQKTIQQQATNNSIPSKQTNNRLKSTGCLQWIRNRAGLMLADFFSPEQIHIFFNIV